MNNEMMTQTQIQRRKAMKEKKNRDMMKREKSHKVGWKNHEYRPQRKGKLNCICQLRFVHSAQFFCFSVNLCSWRDIVRCSYSLPSSLLFYPVFKTKCLFAVLWKEQSSFLLFLLFSWSPWESVLWKELIIARHSSCFPVSWSLPSTLLSLSLVSFFRPHPPSII